MPTPVSSQNPLDLDLETAPDTAPEPLSFRAYVGGVFYLEGIVVLLIGLILMTSYWPPIAAHGRPANPISQVGMWVVVSALVYMIIVGLGFFLHNLRNPTVKVARDDGHRAGVLSRARRYASMKKRTYYIFDSTIRCARDAEDAMEARKLY